MSAVTSWTSHPSPSLSAHEKAWLYQPGSLTNQLRALGAFTIEILDQRHAQATATDNSVLPGTEGAQLWIRSVLMSVAGRPLVVARSIAPNQAVHTEWDALETHGLRPLGEILYDDPSITRKPFEWAVLAADDPLYATAHRYCEEDARLLARRSTFIRHDQPLLIAECFLPDFWRFLESAQQAGTGSLFPPLAGH